MYGERVISNKAPASRATADKFAFEMANNQLLGRVFSSESIGRTWRHELDHLYSDEKKHDLGGKMGYVVRVEVLSDSLITASYIAYYLPIGERTPEQLMKIAEGPGRSEMSGQDWNVYNRAWSQWNRNVEEERKKAVIENKDDKDHFANGPKPIDKDQIIHTIPTLIAIPRKDKEDDESYGKRIELVRALSKKLDELEQTGRIEGFDKVRDGGNITEFIINNKEALIQAIDEAGKEVNGREDNESEIEKNDHEENEEKEIVGDDGNVYVAHNGNTIDR